jgi:hypothetical protein
LLGFARGEVYTGMYEDTIMGGYIAFTLMTKLLAKSFDYPQFSEVSIDERDEI